MKNMTPRAINKDRILAEFRDEGMGIPVILLNSVSRVTHKEQSGNVIPDITGLEAAMAVARVMIDRKLNGKEIKFLRRSLGTKAKDLAAFLDVSPETLSRWENGMAAISINAERVLRLRVINSLRQKALGVPAHYENILDMKISPVRLIEETPIMVFERGIVMIGDEVHEAWLSRGERKVQATNSHRLSA